MLNTQLTAITIDTSDIEWRLKDDMSDLAPEDYGLDVPDAEQIVDERGDDLIEVLMKLAKTKTYRHPYDNDFESWFKNSSYMDSIDNIIDEAIDKWIGMYINDAADELED